MKYTIRFKNQDSEIEWELEGTDNDAIESIDNFIVKYCDFMEKKYGKIGFLRRFFRNGN